MCKCKNYCKMKESCGWCTWCTIALGWCTYILLGTLIMVALLPLTYVCIILLYQFVVARSETNQIASSNLAMYVPSIAIAVFGFLLNKGAFDKPQHVKMEQKRRKEDKKNSALARKIWEEYPENQILKVHMLV